MSTPDWSSLPSVVLFDLYQFLSFHDRLIASSSCKKWRDAFYLYPNWRKLQLDTVRTNEEKNIFIISKAKKHCRSISIAYTAKQFTKVINMLDNWPGNNRVQEVHLLGSGEHYLTFPVRFQTSIFPFLENCTRLMSLFLSHFSGVESLYRLIEKHSSTLIHLGIGKLYHSKTECDSSAALKIPLLPNLLILQLDASHVTEELLFNSIVKFPKLKRLIFNISNDSRIGLISQDDWDMFSHLLPHCEIHINYYRIQSCDKSAPFFLKKCNNITHLRLIYCVGEFQEVCVDELMTKANLVDTMRSVWSFESEHPQQVQIRHPFVICAWRFKNLKELLFSGAVYDLYDIIGMIKMRKNLYISIAKEDIDVGALPDDLKKWKEIIKSLSSYPDWEPMSSKRFNDHTLSNLQREVVTLREIFKDDFETVV